LRSSELNSKTGLLDCYGVLYFALLFLARMNDDLQLRGWIFIPNDNTTTTRNVAILSVFIVRNVFVLMVFVICGYTSTTKNRTGTVCKNASTKYSEYSYWSTRIQYPEVPGTAEALYSETPSPLEVRNMRFNTAPALSLYRSDLFGMNTVVY
jgi:hypothetical protein